LLAKSLVGLETNEEKTVLQLYRAGEIQVKVPLYIHREASLGKLVKAFQTGSAHMAIVLHTSAAAMELRDHADEQMKEMMQTRMSSSHRSES
jgi:hypothetical protein